MHTLVKVIIFSRSTYLENEYTYIYNLSPQILIGDYILVPFGKNNKITSGIVSGVAKIKKSEVRNDYKYVIKLDRYLAIGKELVLLIKYFSNRLGINYNIFLNYIFPKVKKTQISDNTIIGLKFCESFSYNISKKTKEFLKFLEHIKFPLSISSLVSSKNYSKQYIYKKRNEGLITTTYIPEYLMEYITDVSYTLFDVDFFSYSPPLSYTTKKPRKYYPMLFMGDNNSRRIKSYLAYIDNFIGEGKTILYLVPEITLAADIVKIFVRRYGFEQVVLYHSKLNRKQLEYYWQRVKNKKVKILIGTRSAIFSPLSNLGLIICDEEHSATYKQDNIPVYNTREIAVWRAKYNRCTLIFGSQTPSIESYYRAVKGIYKFFKLEDTPIARCTDIKIINMRNESASNQNCALSFELQEDIKQALLRNKQVILFINRRGYAYIIRCTNCNRSAICSKCGALLIYHKEENYFLCHNCSTSYTLFTTCKNCLSDLIFLGIGIQKITEYIKKNITDSVIIADSDNIRNYYKLYQDFSQKKYNILIGTQLILKTFNFTNVSLVGVIDIDSLLNFPDFRCKEKSYQLLNQLARLTDKSKILIQTYDEQYVRLNSFLFDNYEKFILHELKYRKHYFLPPYFNLVQIIFASTELFLNKNSSIRIFNSLKNLKNITIYKPFLKQGCIRNKSIYQLTLKYPNQCILLKRIVKIVKEEEKKDKRSRIYVKLNPENLF